MAHGVTCAGVLVTVSDPEQVGDAMKDGRPVSNERIIYPVLKTSETPTVEPQPPGANAILKSAVSEPDKIIRNEIYRMTPNLVIENDQTVSLFRNAFRRETDADNRLTLLRWGAPALLRSSEMCDFYITILNDLEAEPRLRGAVFEHLKPVLDARSNPAALARQQSREITVGPKGLLTLAEYAYRNGGDLAERTAGAEMILRTLTRLGKKEERQLGRFLNEIQNKSVYVRSALYECVHREKLGNPVIAEWLLDGYRKEQSASRFFAYPPLARAIVTVAEHHPHIKDFVAAELRASNGDLARQTALAEAVAPHFAAEPNYRAAFLDWAANAKHRAQTGGAHAQRAVAVWVNGVLAAAPYEKAAAKQLHEWLDNLAAGAEGLPERQVMQSLLNWREGRGIPLNAEYISALTLGKFAQVLGNPATSPHVRGEIYRILDMTAADPQTKPETVERCRTLLTRRLGEEHDPEARAALFASLRSVVRADRETAVALARLLPQSEPELRRGLYQSLPAAAHEPLVANALWDGLMYEEHPRCLQTLLENAGDIFGKRAETTEAVMQARNIDPLRRYQILAHLGYGRPLARIEGPHELANLFTRNDPIGWVRESNIRALNLSLESNQKWFHHALRIGGPHRELLLTALLEMKRYEFVFEVCREDHQNVELVRKLLQPSTAERQPEWRHPEFVARIQEIENAHHEQQRRRIAQHPGPYTQRLDLSSPYQPQTFRPTTLPPLDL